MCHSVFFILCVLSAFIWRNKDMYFKRLCIFGPKGAIQIRYYYYYYYYV